MVDEKRRSELTVKLMSQINEADTLNDVLAGTLEFIATELNSEAGSAWLLDPDTDRLSSVSYIGSVDMSKTYVENGIGIEGFVTKTGESVLVKDTSVDKRFEGSVFDINGLHSSTVVCVPVRVVNDVIGCFIVVNRKDKTLYGDDELALCEHLSNLVAMMIVEKGFCYSNEEGREVIASLRNVTKEYVIGDNVNLVLKGINLDIYRNEFVVILGESGCGKTTMMNIIGGMDNLTGGTIVIEGKDFSKPSDTDLTAFRRKYVGFIFQQYNLMPNLTALENVRLIAELVDDPMSPEEAIAKVRLTDRSDNYPGQLSGGQQQRVSIARAIVKKPTLILADEPTAALDYVTSVEVLQVLEKIMKEEGTTVIMVTHNAEIAKMADRIVKLQSGKIVSIKKNLKPLHAEELRW